MNDTFGSLGGFWATVRASLRSAYPDEGALALLQQPVRPVHAYNPLVKIESPAVQETSV